MVMQETPFNIGFSRARRMLYILNSSLVSHNPETAVVPVRGLKSVLLFER